ncbi:MAG: glycosyltransferase family 1 protein [Flavobacterium sp.]|nr:MAG: glycosyltransferase family 1 protein [Flavobacterium sp.]
MSKTYIVFYDYSNTSGNHAGMAYLSRFLANELTEVSAIENMNQEFVSGRYVSRIYSFFLAVYLFFVLKKKDKVFFFEYLMKDLGHHEMMARLLRFLGFKGEILGLTHLSGQHLLEYYKDEEDILNRLAPIDRLFVFGSSLKVFFQKIGCKKPIIRTFHYVDTSFYKPRINTTSQDDRMNVLCMGTLKRDYALLKEIIQQSSNVDFHICMGKKDLRSEFGEMKNVILYPFLEELELLELIQKSDVSLSVMEDTVGSNVITTSLAGGLVQIVSEVGSIHDYCTIENSFFCNTTADYLAALNNLNTNRDLLSEMKLKARTHSLAMSKEQFLSEFKSFIK